MSAEPSRADLLARVTHRAIQLRRQRRRRLSSMATILTVVALGVVGAVVAVADRDTGPTRVRTVSPPATSARDPSAFAHRPVACPTPPGKYTQDQLALLRPAIDAMVQGNFEGVGTGANSVVVMLRPGREPLAAQLTDRFGDQVEITVGSTPYCGKPGISPPCPPLTGTEILPAGVHLSLRLDRSMIRRTDSLQGELTVRNDAPTPVQMDPGQPLTALIVEPGTRDVVASHTGLVAGTGLGLALHDGQTATIKVLVGTSLCGGSTGSALTPGSYGVRVGIGRNEGAAEYLAPETQLTITA